MILAGTVNGATTARREFCERRTCSELSKSREKNNEAVVRTKAPLVVWANSPNDSIYLKISGKGMEKYFIVPLCAAKLRTTD
jgi:hypothetical protein